ncbi:NAD(P)-binding protein [Aspergillus coremiiformis]|uniref:NAD(P)-binding protein n=1 Tax=Aspergillus coremiiformis TaxID=138285 RepID=A0A5N6Z6K8_9EURO|nr:NAD(P)-binding protein [Aspergillus coremiiformis]
MVNVAIAGGTGGVGRTILETLQPSTKHRAFVLSRQESKENPNAIAVDYNDIDGLVSVFEKNDIHTVICAFAVEGDSLGTSQMNLIKAATRSQSTKRFIPTGYAIPYPKEALQNLPQLKDHFVALDELRNSGLEWTIFYNGIFLDYYGTPALKSYLKPNVFVLDIANKVAAIPGDGNVPVTFTYTFDLAKFVVAALDLERWEQETRVVGEELTWNQFLALAEEVLETKFEVHYDTVEKLKRLEITELPGHKALYTHFPKAPFQQFMSIFEYFTTDGSSHVQRAGSLNERFPELTLLSARELLEKYWKGK